MAWSFVGVSSAVEVSAGSLSLTEPAGAAPGDLLVAAISYRDSASFTLPAGWALVATQQMQGNVATLSSNAMGAGLMAYMVRGATAPDLTFGRTAGNVALGRVIAYRGGGAYDTGSANTLTAVSATVTTPGFTTAEPGELLIAAACICNDSSASAFTATDPGTPSGATDTATAPTAGLWIERADSLTTTGADVGLAIADAIRETAGATGTFQYTESVAQRSVLIVGAFKVASTGGVAGSGVGAIALAGASAAAVAVTGSASSAFAVTGSASARSAIAGAGSGAITITGAGAAIAAITSAGAGSISLGGSASARVAVSAAASGAFTLSGSATATVGNAAVAASASGAIGLSGAAAAKPAVTAVSIAASIDFAGTAAGKVVSPVIATGSGVLPLSGSAVSFVGSRRPATVGRPGLTVSIRPRSLSTGIRPRAVSRG